MKRLREAERRKRPEGWRNRTWMLHHDNAPAHTSLLMREFLAKHETTVVSRWPLQTLFLFSKVEIHSEGSLISDNRRARRKFTTGPTRYPAKHVPELDKMLEAVYRQWRGVL
jgi:hypothetical protein